MAISNAQGLIAAVERVTGEKATRRNETTIVRVSVTSSDGKKCSAMVQMGTRTFFRKASLKQVANALRLPFDRVEDVLENWTPEKVQAWLSEFPAHALDCRAAERRFESCMPQDWERRFFGD